jgi:hypothetical protein
LTLAGTTTKITAAYIDICTGPGQTRCAQVKAPRGLLDQYLNPPPVSSSAPLQLVTATNFTWEHAHVVDGGLMLVIGNGPAAAQAVERTLEAHGAKQVLWSPSDVNGAFPPTLRLDRLVKQAADHQPLPVRLGFPKGKLLPVPDNLWITESEYAISNIELLTEIAINTNNLTGADGKPLLLANFTNVGVPPLLVTFKPATKTEPSKSAPSTAVDHACVDCAGTPTRQFYFGVFHQIVISVKVEPSSLGRSCNPFAMIK